MDLKLLAAMNAARVARRPAVLVTDVGSGAQRFVEGDALAADPLADLIEPALRSGKSGMVEHGGTSYFLAVQAPPVRFVVIGAVHISQALAPMARLAGFDMTIVDPRTAFATPERFPDVPVIAEWPEVALPPMKLDRYTAMAFFTHDPKIDDPGLVQALRAECFYIGALGSRKTHAKRIERLRAAGFGDAAIARIHAPIGLDIGAVSPAEIAVSVLGEVIASLRKKPLRAEKPMLEHAV
jgi:xanthine dehydrogenase accessory factor